MTADMPSTALRYAAAASCASLLTVLASISGGVRNILTSSPIPKPSVDLTRSPAILAAVVSSSSVTSPSSLPMKGASELSANRITICVANVVSGVAYKPPSDSNDASVTTVLKNCRMGALPVVKSLVP